MPASWIISRLRTYDYNYNWWSVRLKERESQRPRGFVDTRLGVRLSQWEQDRKKKQKHKNKAGSVTMYVCVCVCIWGSWPSYSSILSWEVSQYSGQFALFLNKLNQASQLGWWPSPAIRAGWVWELNANCAFYHLYDFLPNGNPLQYSCLENPMNGGAW